MKMKPMLCDETEDQNPGGGFAGAETEYILHVHILHVHILHVRTENIHGNLYATSEDPWTVDRRCLLEIS